MTAVAAAGCGGCRALVINAAAVSVVNSGLLWEQDTLKGGGSNGQLGKEFLKWWYLFFRGKDYEVSTVEPDNSGWATVVVGNLRKNGIQQKFHAWMEVQCGIRFSSWGEFEVSNNWWDWKELYIKVIQVAGWGTALEGNLTGSSAWSWRLTIGQWSGDV